MKFERQHFYPTVDSLKAVEDGAKRILPEEQALSEWHEVYSSNHKSRIALDLDLTKQEITPNSTVLEFGSVPLLFTAALSSSNYKVIGCDIAPERYGKAINDLGINVIKCNIESEKLPFPDNSFDAVVFNELFEHLRIDLIFTLSEVLRVMKPGGLMMLSSPNLRSLVGVSNFLFRNRAYSCSGNVYQEYLKLQKLGHMGHVREYTTTEVIEFLESVGFVVKKLVYRGRYNTNFRQAMIRLFPALSPFVSYIAEKPTRG